MFEDVLVLLGAVALIFPLWLIALSVVFARLAFRLRRVEAELARRMALGVKSEEPTLAGSAIPVAAPVQDSPTQAPPKPVALLVAETARQLRRRCHPMPLPCRPH